MASISRCTSSGAESRAHGKHSRRRSSRNYASAPWCGPRRPRSTRSRLLREPPRRSNRLADSKLSSHARCWVARPAFTGQQGCQFSGELSGSDPMVVTYRCEPELARYFSQRLKEHLILFRRTDRDADGLRRSPRTQRPDQHTFPPQLPRKLSSILSNVDEQEVCPCFGDLVSERGDFFRQPPRLLRVFLDRPANMNVVIERCQRSCLGQR